MFDSRKWSYFEKMRFSSVRWKQKFPVEVWRGGIGRVVFIQLMRARRRRRADCSEVWKVFTQCTFIDGWKTRFVDVWRCSVRLNTKNDMRIPQQIIILSVQHRSSSISRWRTYRFHIQVLISEKMKKIESFWVDKKTCVVTLCWRWWWCCGAVRWITSLSSMSLSHLLALSQSSLLTLKYNIITNNSVCKNTLNNLLFVLQTYLFVNCARGSRFCFFFNAADDTQRSDRYDEWRLYHICKQRDIWNSEHDENL